MRIRRFDTAAAFLERAEPWLLEQEAQNNLVLAIARRLLSGDHPYQAPIYLATVEDDGAVCGCAYRTPPHKLGITQVPAAAMPLLVDDVAEVYETIPAILGPEGEAMQFADLWIQRVGGKWEPGMRQRVHALEQVIPPKEPAPGALREARAADLSLVADWIASFIRDTGAHGGQSRTLAKRKVDQGAMYLWEDDQIRSMASASGKTQRGIRIGYVYTPPEFRGRGYATTAVAALSQLMLDRGRRFCFLYTDLANPTSNAIYKRIGYESVCDVVDVNFLDSRSYCSAESGNGCRLVVFESPP